MRLCSGFIRTYLVILIATILYGKTALSTAQCMDVNLVTILPDNGHYDTIKGHTLKGHLLSSIQTGTHGHITCAALCTRDVNCKSFNYSPDTSTCELNNGTDALNPGDLEPESGFDYFNYAWSQFKGCTFTTPSDYCYQFMFPRLPDGTKRIEFSVKTSMDAMIGLTTENKITYPMHEIVIGGGGDTTIFIRRGKNGATVDYISSPDLLSDQEFHRFWINFENGLTQVGRHLETTPLFEWQDPGVVFPIHYISFASYVQFTGDWILHSFCDFPG